MRRSLIRAMSPIVATAAFAFACGGGGEGKAADSTAAMDSAAAAAAATPAPESFSMVGKSPNWSVEVTPTGILFDGPKTSGKPDTIQFEYKAPTINGAIREFTVIRMQPDTHRIDITLAMTKCKAGDAEMEWKATVWVDQKAYNGCATKK
ncbi:MAG: hypothetical protein MNPFHGCM_00779 [Gemmatimonadaceae bacterium]|nr:hypothetical protein [Gemmatimonadaceae bacterium]